MKRLAWAVILLAAPTIPAMAGADAPVEIESSAPAIADAALHDIAKRNYEAYFKAKDEGRYDEAVSRIEQASAAFKIVGDADVQGLLFALYERALMRMELRGAQEALDAQGELESHIIATRGSEAPIFHAARLLKAEILIRAGRAADALTALKQEFERRGEKPSARLLADSHVATALRMMEARDYAGAREKAERALQIYRKSFPALKWLRLPAERALADAMRESDDLEKADAQLRRVVAAAEEAYRPHHPDVARDLLRHADFLDDIGRAREARALRERAADIAFAAHGVTHPLVVRARLDLASSLKDAGRPQDVPALLRDVADAAPGAVGDFDRFRALVKMAMAQFLLGDAKAFSRSARAAVGLVQNGGIDFSRGDSEGALVEYSSLAGLALYATGKHAEAVRMFRDLLDVARLEEFSRKGMSLANEARMLLAFGEEESGRPHAALEVLREARRVADRRGYENRAFDEALGASVARLAWSMAQAPD